MKKLLVASLFVFFVIVFVCVLWGKPVLAAPGPTPGQQQAIGQASGLLDTYAPSMPEHVTEIFPLAGTPELNPLFIQSTIGRIVPSLGFVAMPSRIDANGNLVSIRNAGPISFFASGIQAMTEIRPASSIEYVAYQMNRLHVPGTPQVAYAADSGGLGFKSLTPVLQLWTLMRNLAYVIFAIIFVVIGVMIMTRQKIDPKTVASIQNALPKIVFSLILVTFSYAIAGFLIDLMYVALGLIVTIFTGVNTGQGADLKTLLSGSIFNFVFTGTGLFGTALGVASVVGDIVDSMLGLARGPGAQGSIFGVITGGLAFLIVAIAILVALFKTWLALIGAYANIILGIIFAPLRLTLDAIPGQNQFGNWMKDMLANLLTFPLVTVMLAIGAAIATNFGQGVNSGSMTDGFVPPLIGAGSQQAAQAFVGLGILLTIPKALDILRETLKTPQFKYGGAWMESAKIGAGTTYNTVGGAAGGATQGFLNERFGADVDSRRKQWEAAKPGRKLGGGFRGWLLDRGIEQGITYNDTKPKPKK